MRHTQYIGHVEKAYEIMSRSDIVEELKQVTGVVDEYVCTLYRYKDKATGKIWTEYVQHQFWSNGPVIFLALRGDGEVIGWEEDREMKNDYDRKKGTFKV